MSLPGLKIKVQCSGWVGDTDEGDDDGDDDDDGDGDGGDDNIPLTAWLSPVTLPFFNLTGY